MNFKHFGLYSRAIRKQYADKKKLLRITRAYIGRPHGDHKGYHRETTPLATPSITLPPYTRAYIPPLKGRCRVRCQDVVRKCLIRARMHPHAKWMLFGMLYPMLPPFLQGALIPPLKGRCRVRCRVRCPYKRAYILPMLFGMLCLIMQLTPTLTPLQHPP